ncbi:MAG: protein kinase [Desulfovibrio sp.]|jgi:serine/threonine protein kinase|nr:protein kinase [Desulfovibrio sp.]
MGRKKEKKYKKLTSRISTQKAITSRPLVNAYDVFDDSRCVAERKSKDRFILDKVLGIGGLCEVFMATDLFRVACGDKFPQVAIKRLLFQYAKDCKAQQLLVREFIVTRMLNHEGIIRCYDLHDTSYGPVISMELLEGELLSSLRLGLKDNVLPIAQSLFNTLHFMHTHRIAHGDIKPGNLMLERNSRLVLFDFNTADAEASMGVPSSAVTRSICAELCIPSYSPLYASPDRIEGAMPSTADDIFSACCTLVELAEGWHPFNKKSSLEAKKNGAVGIDLKYLPKKLQRLLRRGLSMDPKTRPASQDFCSFFDDRFFFHRIFG